VHELDEVGQGQRVLRALAAEARQADRVVADPVGREIALPDAEAAGVER
jgi:hypothetical protein